MTLLGVVLLLLLLLLFWKLGKRNHNYFSSRNIPGPYPWPYLGNLCSMIRENRMQLANKWQKKYGSVFGMYFGSIPMLTISDITLIDEICIKYATHFTDRFSLSSSGSPLNESITNLKGKEWKRVRDLLTPSFTCGKLKNMVPAMKGAIKVGKEILQKKAENNEVLDIKKFYQSLTMDVLARTHFGVKINRQDDPQDEFVKYVDEIFKVSVSNMTLLLLFMWPELGPVMDKLKPRGFLSKNAHNYFMNIIERAIQCRKNDPNANDSDLLGMMLRVSGEKMELGMKNGMPLKDSKQLSKSEMLAQAFIFVIAGYETSASTLQFCSYFLAMHPDLQEEVREEAQAVFDVEENVNYENTKRLILLHQFIQETLRLCPPTSVFNRTANCDIDLTDSNGQVWHIEKGQAVTVNAGALHYDPIYYEEPEKFDPHRFSSDEMKKRPPNVYLPFGLGPRNCLGKRFALMEIQMILGVLLCHVRFEATNDTPKKLTFSNAGFLAPIEPIKLKVVPM